MVPRTTPPYPPQFRAQMVELVRTGRSPEELARKFEPSAQSMRDRARQSKRDEGIRTDDLTTSERQGLTELRRQNRRLREEPEIL